MSRRTRRSRLCRSRRGSSPTTHESCRRGIMKRGWAGPQWAFTSVCLRSPITPLSPPPRYSRPALPQALVMQDLKTEDASQEGGYARRRITAGSVVLVRGEDNDEGSPDTWVAMVKKVGGVGGGRWMLGRVVSFQLISFQLSTAATASRARTPPSEHTPSHEPTHPPPARPAHPLPPAVREEGGVGAIPGRHCLVLPQDRRAQRRGGARRRQRRPAHGAPAGLQAGATPTACPALQATAPAGCTHPCAHRHRPPCTLHPPHPHLQLLYTNDEHTVNARFIRHPAHAWFLHPADPQPTMRCGHAQQRCVRAVAAGRAVCSRLQSR